MTQNKITNERIAALRSAMLAAGADACLIPSGDPHLSEYLPDHWAARRYFSGFTGSVGDLAVTRTGSALWVDGRYFVQAERQLAGSEITLQKVGLPGTPTLEEYFAAAVPAGGVLALDGTVTATARVRRLQTALTAKGGRVLSVDLAGPLWTLRPPAPATPAWLLGVQYAGATPAQKLALLRAELARQSATALLITRLDSAAWLLNLRAADLECTPFALCWCFVTQKSATLFIEEARLCPADRAALQSEGVTLRPAEDLLPFLQQYAEAETLLADADGINYALWCALQENPHFALHPAPDPIQALKAVKNEIEIACLRAAHLRDGLAMVEFQWQLEQRLAAGEVTECEVEALCTACRAAQTDYLMDSFAPIAAYGANAAMMHYQARPDAQATLQKCGFLLLDSGGQYRDGTTDITRTYALGPLTEDERRWYTLVLKSHIAIERAMFLAGCTGGNLDVLAREPLWREGLDYRCGTGHGVGFVGGVHEGPHGLRLTDRTVLRPGMVVTDEPGVYESGLVGIRIENMLLCVPGQENEYGQFLQFEPLTCCPIDTAPLLPALLDEAERRWLDEYHAWVWRTLSPCLPEDRRDWLRAKTAPLCPGNPI